MSQGTSKAKEPARWEVPRLVKLDALPTVLGACINGSTHTENPGGICRNGAYPTHKCKMGMNGDL